jgi:hypothetical protein
MANLAVYRTKGFVKVVDNTERTFPTPRHMPGGQKRLRI